MPKLKVSSITKNLADPVVVKLTSLLFFPFLVVLSIVMLWFYSEERLESFDAVRASHLLEHDILQHTINNNVTASYHFLEVNYLKALDWVDKRKSLSEVEKDFVDYMAVYADHINQLRILDTKGFELIRVDVRDGLPVVASKELLQDKSERYYVKQASQLTAGQVFQSPFDLNV